jgi:hypothetical protein
MTDSSAKPPPTSRALTRRPVHAALFCLPVAFWVGVIALASTSSASQAHTNVWLSRVMHRFSPGTLDGHASTGRFGALSYAMRKSAHLVEYGMLGLLATGALKALFPRYADGTNRSTLGRLTVVVIPLGTLVA